MLLALILACTSSEKDPSDTGGGDTGATDSASCTGPGALSLTVRMDADFTASMEEPPVGDFHGSVFADADADGMGPVDGASSLLDFTIPDVDLTDGGGPDTDALVTDAIDPQIVWVLGCLDSDANDCDHGDMVTIPGQNKVEVLCGAPTAFEIYLGITQP
jgi:hypothetical protein